MTDGCVVRRLYPFAPIRRCLTHGVFTWDAAKESPKRCPNA